MCQVSIFGVASQLSLNQSEVSELSKHVPCYYVMVQLRTWLNSKWNIKITLIKSLQQSVAVIGNGYTRNWQSLQLQKRLAKAIVCLQVPNPKPHIYSKCYLFSNWSLFLTVTYRSSTLFQWFHISWCYRYLEISHFTNGLNFVVFPYLVKLNLYNKKGKTKRTKVNKQ